MACNNLGDCFHTWNRRFLWIKVVRILGHIFHEGCSEDLAKLGCVVNLANTVLDCLCYLVIWDTRSSVKNQRNIKTLTDCLQDTLLNVGGTVVDAMSGTNADCKRSAVSTCDKLFSLVWISIGVLALNSWTVVFFTADFAEFCLNRKVNRASKFSDRCGKCNVVLKRLQERLPLQQHNEPLLQNNQGLHT